MKTILITGANRGLGFELAKIYGQSGQWNVIATTRDPSKAADLKKLPHTTIETLEVSDPDSITALTKKLSGTPIDLLINNAGIAGEGGFGKDERQTFGTLDYDVLDDVITINAKAPLQISEALLPLMAKGSKIIMMSSISASIERQFFDGIDYASYAISKAALNMGGRIMAATLKKRGIIVVLQSPGWARTDMGGPNATLSSAESAAGMKKQIDGYTLEHTGCFIDYDGTEIVF